MKSLAAACSVNENGSVLEVLRMDVVAERAASGPAVQQCFLGYAMYTVNPADLIPEEEGVEELLSEEAVGLMTLVRMNYYGLCWRKLNLDQNTVAGIVGLYLASEDVVVVVAAAETVYCPRCRVRTGLVTAALETLS